MKASTQFKLRLAKIIYQALRLIGIPLCQIIRRNDLFFEVDLSEGIDLSLFLFGTFQSHIAVGKHFVLPRNGVIIDVGANIGAQTLPFAKSVPEGHVYAIEPTEYALEKLRRNVELNPALAQRIEIIPAFVSSFSCASSNLTAYASWKLDRNASNIHPIHGGQIKESTVGQITIDELAETRRLSAIHLIKIDTDGHELDVLKGSTYSLQKYHPFIVFELTTYLLEERNISFMEYEDILKPLGYILRDSETMQEVHTRNITKLVPRGGSIDVLALPS